MNAPAAQGKRCAIWGTSDRVSVLTNEQAEVIKPVLTQSHTSECDAPVSELETAVVSNSMPSMPDIVTANERRFHLPDVRSQAAHAYRVRRRVRQGAYHPGNFVTIFKDGVNSKWFQGATPR